MVTASGDGTGRVWDAQTGRELVVLPGCDGWNLAFSPDNKRVVGGSKMWDAETGQELMTLQHVDGGIYGLAFRPDGYRLAVKGGGNVRIYDATPLAEKP